MLARLTNIITIIGKSFDWAMDLPDNTQLPTEPASSGTLESTGKDISVAYISAICLLETTLTSLTAHVELHNEGRWALAPEKRPASPSVRKKRQWEPGQGLTPDKAC